jgi:hypothetical protein
MYIYMCVFACVCACLRVCVCVSVCVYIHTYIHTGGIIWRLVTEPTLWTGMAKSGDALIPCGRGQAHLFLGIFFFEGERH